MQNDRKMVFLYLLFLSVKKKKKNNPAVNCSFHPNHLTLLACSPGSMPSSIFGGIPPPNPWDALASIRAVLAACDSALTRCGDLLSWFEAGVGGARCSLGA